MHSYKRWLEIIDSLNVGVVPESHAQALRSAAGSFQWRIELNNEEIKALEKVRADCSHHIESLANEALTFSRILHYNGKLP